MRRTQSRFDSVQVMDVWPPVELSLENIPRDQALQWLAQRIVELKTWNLRFIRAMDIAEVDPSDLPDDFLESLEFIGTADGYLTVALQMVRDGKCKVKEVPSLVKAVSMLADSLGDARKEMLSTMADTLKSEVLQSELTARVEPGDVEEELAELQEAGSRPSGTSKRSRK